MFPESTQSPPTKASLRAWWNNFTNAQRKREEPGKGLSLKVGHAISCLIDRILDDVPHTVFGKPLKESLQYASVQISTANANGELYVWGYIPVVVAKWYVLKLLRSFAYLTCFVCSFSGLYLKENGELLLVFQIIFQTLKLSF
jgi:hypothetical protein